MTSSMLRCSIPVLAVAAFLALTGCSTSTTYAVKVDAIAKHDGTGSATDAHSFKIKSKNPAVGDENLRYREAADYLKTALSAKGMYEAADLDRADVIVELDYGMEAPRTKIENVSVPRYSQLGGGVSYEQVPIMDNRGNTAVRTVAVYRTPRTELTGYEEMPQRVTIYEKYLRVTARENKPAAEGRPPAEIWSVNTSTEDESKDLRKYLPIMASATAEYIGKDTTKQQIVKIKDPSQVVDFIRRGMPDANTPAPQTPPTTTDRPKS